MIPTDVFVHLLALWAPWASLALWVPLAPPVLALVRCISLLFPFWKIRDHSLYGKERDQGSQGPPGSPGTPSPGSPWDPWPLSFPLKGMISDLPKRETRKSQEVVLRMPLSGLESLLKTPKTTPFWKIRDQRSGTQPVEEGLSKTTLTRPIKTSLVFRPGSAERAGSALIAACW